MGGWMDYQRMRERAGLRRKPNNDPDPYFREATMNNVTLHEGDLNRMERDYLNPQYPEPPWATREAGSDPSSQVAEMTGVDVETVRKVLRAVFFGAVENNQ
jgi:hypothetical protein